MAPWQADALESLSCMKSAIVPTRQGVHHGCAGHAWMNLGETGNRSCLPAETPFFKSKQKQPRGSDDRKAEVGLGLREKPFHFDVAHAVCDALLCAVY